MLLNIKCMLKKTKNMMFPKDMIIRQFCPKVDPPVVRSTGEPPQLGQFWKIGGNPGFQDGSRFKIMLSLPEV